jgi:hypothetical protein
MTNLDNLDRQIEQSSLLFVLKSIFVIINYIVLIICIMLLIYSTFL